MEDILITSIIVLNPSVMPGNKKAFEKHGGKRMDLFIDHGFEV